MQIITMENRTRPAHYEKGERKMANVTCKM